MRCARRWPPRCPTASWTSICGPSIRATKMAPRSCTRAPRGTPNSTPGSSVWSRKSEHTVGQAPAAGLQTRRCTARDLTTSHQPRGVWRAVGTASFARRRAGPGGPAQDWSPAPPDSFAKIMACMTPNAELRQALYRARQQTDSLFDLVDPAALYERPIPERHRLVFYLGHLEAFDWNLLGRALDMPAFHAGFDQLFSFGIDPGSGDLPTDRPADWPAADEVRDYNARVRGTLDAALARAPEELMHVAIEHRLMHGE